MLVPQFLLYFLKNQRANFLRLFYKSHPGWLISVSKKPLLRICLYQHARNASALSIYRYRERIMLHCGSEVFSEGSDINLALHRVQGLKNVYV